MVDDVANYCRLQDSFGYWQHIYIWFPSTLLYCWLPMPCAENCVAVKGLSISSVTFLHYVHRMNRPCDPVIVLMVITCVLNYVIT